MNENIVHAVIEEEKEDTMKFPKHYPENCPPQDAINAEGVYYRAVRKIENIIDEDFESFFILNPKIDYSDSTCKS